MAKAIQFFGVIMTLFTLVFSIGVGKNKLDTIECTFADHKKDQLTREEKINTILTDLEKEVVRLSATNEVLTKTCDELRREYKRSRGN